VGAAYTRSANHPSSVDVAQRDAHSAAHAFSAWEVDLSAVTTRTTSAAAGVVAIATLAASALVSGCATSNGSPTANASAAYEDIFVLRSERIQRNPNSTWCTVDRAGFAPRSSPTLLEDTFTFYSVQTQRSDGRVVDARAARVGEARTCFGPTENPRIFNFYIETALGQVPIVGAGECTVLRADVPEKGIVSVRCTVPLKVSSDAYVGGVLVTSTLSSNAVMGGETDPPGYAQASIATIRLWRRH
jgi:hypothetical protein